MDEGRFGTMETRAQLMAQLPHVPIVIVASSHCPLPSTPHQLDLYALRTAMSRYRVSHWLIYRVKLVRIQITWASLDCQTCQTRQCRC